jgi:hypothetical protein
MWNTKKIDKNSIINRLYSQNKIHLQSKMSVYVGIFLRLIKILLCYSWGLSHWVVNGLTFSSNTECKFWKQGRVALGLWTWCLFLMLILCIDAFVWKFPDYWYWSSLVKVYTGMEQVGRTKRHKTKTNTRLLCVVLNVISKEYQTMLWFITFRYA